MEGDGRLTVRVAAGLPVDEVAVPDLQHSLVVGLDLGVELFPFHPTTLTSALPSFPWAGRCAPHDESSARGAHDAAMSLFCAGCAADLNGGAVHRGGWAFCSIECART